MKPDRVTTVLPWAAAAVVAAVLLASWVSLLGWHAAFIATGAVQQVDRNTIVPKAAVEIIGFAAVGIALLGIAVRIWRRSSPVLLQEIVDLLRRRRAGGDQTAAQPLRRPLVASAREIAGGGMRDCEDAQQWVAHILIMWGFVGLFVTTALDAVVNRAALPLPLLHPVRLLGNATGIAFMAGLTLAIVRRAVRADLRAASARGDWTFLLALWGTGATGFLVQWFADRAGAPATAWLYVTHLGFVGLILATAPWTKFMHAVWRPSWVVYRALATPPRR